MVGKLTISGSSTQGITISIGSATVTANGTQTDDTTAVPTMTMNVVYE